MTVKDLVEHFDSPSTVGALADAGGSLRSLEDIPQRAESVPRHPVSNPARFLNHAGRMGQSIIENTSDPFLHIAASHQSVQETTLDITDLVETPRPLSYSGFPIHSKLFPQPLIRRSPDHEDEYALLYRGAHEYTYESDTPSSTSSIPVHRSQSRHGRKHIPIPSTVVFSRDAPSLYLPKLDRILSSLPLPAFHDNSKAMFSPMNKLAESGKSLDDLETNKTVAPAWRNRKTLLGSTVNIVLGFTGSSALASFYSLQGLLNTIQIFALILSTIGEASSDLSAV
ncbi:hypothetical protein FPV67DRAFT_71140 [Lyophyllum atratum]|nr:hypothetical protein FPV67DRAFT_71140 [Lyophyllum atratum]